MKIFVKPRIHISLISMHGDGYRVNGGIGFAIKEPTGILTISPAQEFEFKDQRKCPFSQSELEQLATSVNETQLSLKLKSNVRVTFEGGMLTHYGMGSATAVRLGVLESLLRLNKKPARRRDLVTYSNRGGTSGIGINTYFDGGFVFDLGAKKLTTGFIPSSKALYPESPLVLDSIDMPDWNIGLCIPKHVKAKTQEEEVEFFDRVCPIRSEETYKLLYHSLYGTYASIRDNDLTTFADSIRNIQTCEWKQKERNEYGDALAKLERKLYQFGAVCVGMSSLGPLLFFLSYDERYERIVDGMKDEECDLLITSCSNSGRKIIV